MSYLYGDSTASSLEVNYIDLVREVVGFCAEALGCELRVAQGRVRLAAMEQSAAADGERLRRVEGLVAGALQEQVKAGESAEGRCAAMIVRAAADAVAAELTAARAAIDAEAARCTAEATRELGVCLEALQRLLLAYDLPETHVGLHVGLAGTRYATRAILKTAFGLEARLDLEVPAGHLLAEIVRVDRLADRLEVHAPELAGWLHKEVKLRPQRLDRHHVAELSIASGESTLKLRAETEGPGPGFDLAFRDETPRATLTRVDERGAPAGAPFELSEADATKVRALRDKLAAAATELLQHRKALLGATLDGAPLGVDGSASRLVERMVGAIAPTVREIAARSQSTGELVLRRLLGDGRREELFVSKAELQQKVEPLPAAARLLFAPLWVEDHPVPAADAAAATAPPRLPRRTPPLGSPMPAPAPPASDPVAAVAEPREPAAAAPNGAGPAGPGR
jgi:hypothetical protein